MQTQKFSIAIDAPKEKVWSALWDDASYTEWTVPFAPGSKAVSDWKEGSKILFVDQSGAGMVGRIAEKRDNEFMSFEHLGMIKDGVEDTTSDSVREWAGATENYTLSEIGDKTNVMVEMNFIGITTEMLDFFANAWPLALEKLKEIAERN